MKRSTLKPAIFSGALLLALMGLCFGCGGGGGEGDADADTDVQDVQDAHDAQDTHDVPDDGVPDNPSDPDAAEQDHAEVTPDSVQDADAADMGELEQACVDSGGTVDTRSCCLSAEDFPNLCNEGPCGCSPENSHNVLVCECGTGKCFDGTACVTSP